MVVEGMARPEGFEPPTYGFEARRSIQLSYGRTQAIASRTEPQLVNETNLHHNGRIGAAQALSWRRWHWNFREARVVVGIDEAGL